MKPASSTVPRVTEAHDLNIAIVVSSYHGSITEGLTEGARNALSDVGVAHDRVTVLTVPGAFELPIVARRAAETQRFQAVICLGCVIRGETPHFDYIASAVAHGITTAAQSTGVPISFGVLTTNSYDEAAARAGSADTNKGREAALAAVGAAHAVRGLSQDHVGS